ncbi:sporulation protein [Paenibacillus sp. SYP-B3998]|uniref:Sporulation protein n=1 Tax=Paenibacillus sp. SYP-B3998 TaxID=2678564 RepID=A0A6G3ZTN6_9BACL|nr:nucleoside recognition domain-containing protein [Paenibacillus sp. SYP-B3998]NEW05502.1 sporulation protein [Paenibacillus sp. SYP-B3998]
MQRMHSKSGSTLTTLLLGALAALVVVSIILFPDLAFQSSLEGLTIWWKLVFPALLPFFIMTELLIGFGVIQGAGTLFEPLMRILFRLPGVSGWALASGLIVGFPTGAKITASLREKGLITRIETERLTALSHLCSPIFIIMVVGVGFLHNAQLGILLTIIHYTSALLTGFLMRNSKENRGITQSSPELSASIQSTKKPVSTSIWKRALTTMREAYLHDGRAFGKLLGDSVTSSVQTLMLIGGYMMIFSVLINVVNIVHLTQSISFVTGSLLGFLNITTDTAPQWIKGVFEIHLGAYAFSQIEDFPLLPQMALIGAFLGWGGLSTHAQVASFHQKTDARYVSFLLARALHAGLAFVLTVFLWKPLVWLLKDAEPSFLWLDSAVSEHQATTFPLNGETAWGLLGPMLSQLMLLLIVMLMASVSIQIIRNRISR